MQPTPRAPSREEWLALEPVLDQAMELPASEVRSFLAGHCDGDNALLAWLERFVAGSQSDGFPIAMSASIVAGAFADAESSDERFGAWRMVREIGRGGMGTVYLAERADGQFEQQVAIKVMHRGIRDAAGRERFLRERQILARLDHPNVAHLIDGGVTSEGQPWFAMEHIDGPPIDTWCDERRATVEQRLALFLSVCEAVQVAHQRLVIHRDLKPSNILVSGDGQPKLLDFGIARILQDSDAALTQTGTRTLTPDYAAPEQWRGEAPGTGSDVYALGVILCELLTGARPLRLRGEPETSWPRIVLDGVTQPPSALVTDAMAAIRGTTSDRLRRRLRDDLDTIVLTALQAEVERRYRSVDQLTSDIRRHLAGHPIAARPDTWHYRTTKFVRRHRAGVAAGTLVVLSLMGGAAGIAWQSRRVAHEAARATAAKQFLAGAFVESDPDSARGDSLTAGALLDRATARLDNSFRSQPDVRLDLLLALGEIYRKLGRLPTADSLITRATALADSLHSALLPNTWVALATVRLAAGELESADTLVRRGLSGLGSDTATAGAYTVLGTIKRRQFDYVAAESAFRRVLAIDERSGADSAARSWHWNDFAVLLIDAGRYHEADTALRKALAFEAPDTPANAPSHVLGLMNYAQVRDYLGDKDTAAVIGREVLRLQRVNYPDGHERVATALNTLGFGAMDRGELAEADALFTEAIDMLTRLYGPNLVPVLIARNNRARTWLLAGQTRRAELEFRQVFEDARRVLGDGHGYVSQPLHWLGRALLAQGRAADARRTLDSALVLARAALPAEHERFADLPAAIAAAALAVGDTVVADSMAQAALRHREAHLGPESVEGTEPLLVMARVRALEGHRAVAESLFVRALGTLERHTWLRWRSAPVRRELSTWQQRWSR